jgi:uncharacterized cupredoxin-like copper-binding protein
MPTTAVSSTGFSSDNSVAYVAAAANAQTAAPILRLACSSVIRATGVSAGQVLLGKSVTLTFTISNKGTAPLLLTGSTPVQITGDQASDFQATQPSATAIPIGGSLRFTVTFSPQAMGVRSAVLTVASNATNGQVYSVAMAGTGTAPMMSVSGNTDFGAVLRGQSATRTFVVKNTGTAPLILTGASAVQIVGADASDFRIMRISSKTVAPGRSATVTVRFTPSSDGSRSATAAINSNAINQSLFQLALVGTAVSPAISVVGSTAFSPTIIGQAVTQFFTICNTGTATLVLTNRVLVQIAGAQAKEFKVTQPTVKTLTPGATAAFLITFKPSAIGNRTATMRILSNAFGQKSFQVGLSGTGAAPAISVSGTVQFGQVAIGNSISQTYTITNTGTADLTLSGNSPITISGAQASDFQITQPGAATLAPGSSTTFTVTFSPLGPGTRTATLKIGSNARNAAAYTLQLTGVGPGVSGTAAFTVSGISGATFSGPTYCNGFYYFTVRSSYQSSATVIRVMAPTNMTSGVRYRVIYVLPVEAGLGTQFGDGLTTLKSLGVNNTTNTIYVEPSFSAVPWYVNNSQTQAVWQETYFTSVVVPFIDRMFPTVAAADGRLLLGYSKSGYGAFTLLLRHSDLFESAYAWNSPLNISDPSTGWGFAAALGTASNFQNYDIPALLREHADEFQNQPARFFFGGQSYEYSSLINDERTIDQLMTSLNIAHVFTAGNMVHHLWNSGWMLPAVTTLLSA